MLHILLVLILAAVFVAYLWYVHLTIRYGTRADGSLLAPTICFIIMSLITLATLHIAK